MIRFEKALMLSKQLGDKVRGSLPLSLHVLAVPSNCSHSALSSFLWCGSSAGAGWGGAGRALCRAHPCSWVGWSMGWATG